MPSGRSQRTAQHSDQRSVPDLFRLAGWGLIQRRDRGLSLGDTEIASKKQKRLPPIHPGEVLQDLLKESGLTVNALALALRVPANRIGGIVKGESGITVDTAMRLARDVGASAQMWVNLQAKYELAAAEDALSTQEQVPHPGQTA